MAGRSWETRYKSYLKGEARRERRLEDDLAVEEGLTADDCHPPPGLFFDPNWRTVATLGLARHIDATHDFASLPVLGDALLDAGCDHPDVIGHCMKPGPHLRRCWVVDRLLRRA